MASVSLRAWKERYATNIEIFEYLTALNRLYFSAECSIVENPNSIPVWISINNEKMKISPGETRVL